jgi:hypothetical protein
MTHDTNDENIHDQSDALRDAANQFADRMDHVASEMRVARVRLGRQLERVGDAVADFGKDAERPARGVARALDDLAHEARRGFERMTRPPPRTFLDRLFFWR